MASAYSPAQQLHIRTTTASVYACSPPSLSVRQKLSFPCAAHFFCLVVPLLLFWCPSPERCRLEQQGDSHAELFRFRALIPPPSFTPGFSWASARLLARGAGRNKLRISSHDRRLLFIRWRCLSTLTFCFHNLAWIFPFHGLRTFQKNAIRSFNLDDFGAFSLKRSLEACVLCPPKL
jgi:hypothetical protein